MQNFLMNEETAWLEKILKMVAELLVLMNKLKELGGITRIYHSKITQADL